MATRPKAANGEGIIRKIIVNGEEKFQCQLTVTDRNGENHRRSKTHKVQKVVIDWRDKLKREAAAGSAARPKAVMVPDVVDLWLKTQCGGKAPTTMTAYEGAYRMHIKPMLKIRTEKLDKTKLHTFLRQVAGMATGNGVVDGRATAKHAHTVLHAAMAWAESEDGGYLVPRNLIAKVRFPLGATRKRKAVPLNDVVDILAASAGKPSQLLWRMFMETGARRGEITGLDVEHVSVRKHEISIRQIATPESGGRKVEPRTKSKTNREISIPAELMVDLAALIAGKGPHDPVFAGPRSPRLSFATLRGWFIRDMKAAGMDEYTVHQLRHFFATEALSNGVSMAVVQEILGHSSPTTTMEIYAHVKLGAKEAAADTVASAIASAVANSVANAAASKLDNQLEKPAA